jgi:hypothetical protein
MRFVSFADVLKLAFAGEPKSREGRSIVMLGRVRWRGKRREAVEGGKKWE